MFAHAASDTVTVEGGKIRGITAGGVRVFKGIPFAAPPVGHPFDVCLARTGLAVHVPSERSLLEALEAVGVEAPSLCRGGVCGECETGVLELEGELLHNDHWLSPEDRAAGRKIMPCVSRARCTRLVLDR